MKRQGIILSVLLLALLWAGTAEAATARRNNPAQAPADVLPPPQQVPDEFFAPGGECSKEESEALDGLDEQFLELSAEDARMDRSTQKIMQFLLEENNMGEILQLYIKCGRTPKMQPLNTDPEVMKEDMRRLEELNRR